MNGSYTTILVRGSGGSWNQDSMDLPLSYFYVQDAEDDAVILYPESLAEAPHAADLVAAWVAAAVPQATVLLAEVQEGEELRLHLWKNGVGMEEYVAEPGYEEGEDLPAWGDSEQFCAAFGIADQTTRDELGEIFRAGRYDELYGFNDAQERHRDIADLLGLSAASIGTHYTDLLQGTLPEGITDIGRVHPVMVPADLEEYAIFAALPDTSEAQIAAHFLPQVVSFDDDFLGEDEPDLGSGEQVYHHFLSQGWSHTVGEKLLTYQSSSGARLISEPPFTSGASGCPAVFIWGVGIEHRPVGDAWEKLCREKGWGVWSYRTRRVIYPPAA